MAMPRFPAISRALWFALALPALALVLKSYMLYHGVYVQERLYVEHFGEHQLEEPPRAGAETRSTSAPGTPLLHVAYASDSLDGTLASMVSLARHLHDPGRCVIHFIVPGKNMPKARRMVECFHSAVVGKSSAVPSVRLYELRPVRFNISALSFPFNIPLAYAKFYLHEYLPDVSRVIWLDHDTIVKSDIQALYEQSMRHALAAVPLTRTVSWWLDNFNTKFAEIEQFHNATSLCFNTGVLVLDLERWRSEPITQRLEEYVMRCRGSFWEQLAFNLVFLDNFDHIDWRWNLAGLGCNQPNHDQKPFCLRAPQRYIDAAHILHWSGQLKPWARWRPPDRQFTNIYVATTFDVHREEFAPYYPGRERCDVLRFRT